MELSTPIYPAYTLRTTAIQEQRPYTQQASAVCKQAQVQAQTPQTLSTVTKC